MPQELSPVLERLFAEYDELLSKVEQDEASALDLAVMKIAQWEPDFRRNPDAEVVEQQTEAWARHHGIWKEGYSEHTNTMGAYLHPETASPRILNAIDKTYLILFYIDDTFSNELQKDLSPEERTAGEQIMRELFQLIASQDRLGQLPSSRFGVVNATRELIQDLQELADPAWLERFMVDLVKHLEDTAQDQNEQAIGEKFTRLTFLERRNDISGMFVTNWYMEFATGQYLPREVLPLQVSQLCERINYLCAIIGGTANEFYSFEKEVIDHRDEFNIIPITMINNPEMGLMAAITDCMEFLNQSSQELLEVSDQLTQLLPSLPAEQAKPVQEYLRQARFVALASWFWELDTDRYQRQRSIFQQTALQWRQAHGYTGKLRSGQPLAA